MSRPAKRGFTLVELLLVIAIFMLITGMVVPFFFSSFAGAKLRTSVRAVVMTHRYARNLAVLRQRPVVVVVNLPDHTLQVVLLTGRESEELAELTTPPDAATTLPAADTTQGETGAEDTATVELLKTLAPGITIASFESPRPGGDTPDTPSAIVYYPSGLCDGFTLRLRDEREHSAEITADPLTGQADVAYPEP
jgi:type II secretion system protein H